MVAIKLAAMWHSRLPVGGNSLDAREEERKEENGGTGKW